MKKRKKKQSSEAKLQEIYDSIPSIECKGKCFDACGPIPLTKLELGRLNWARLIPIHQDDVMETFGKNQLIIAKVVDLNGRRLCPALSGTRCSAYEGRPAICRLYGVVRDPKMICQHGCKPTRWLSNKETAKIIADVGKLK